MLLRKSLPGGNSIISDGSSRLDQFGRRYQVVVQVHEDPSLNQGTISKGPLMRLSRSKGGSGKKEHTDALSAAGHRLDSALGAQGLRQIMKHNFMDLGG